MLAALIFAATMAAEPAAAMAQVGAQPWARPSPLAAGRVCRDDAGLQQARRNPATLPRTRKSKLGDLPKPDLELMVERRINGCVSPVRTRLQIQGDGKFANPNFEAEAPTTNAPAVAPPQAEDAVEP